MLRKTLALALTPLLATTAPAQLTSDPPDAPPPVATGPRLPDPSLPANTITAVVVRSHTAGWGFFNQLNNQWANFGSTPIAIDATTLATASSFTYEQLAATGADVVILSDSAGGREQFTPAEVAAVQQYAQEGHTVIGTFKLFQHQSINNSALAPIFGLRGEVAYSTNSVGIGNNFHVKKEHRILRGTSRSGWKSKGYAFTESMALYPRWNTIDLAGAQIIAECNNYKAVVTVYTAPTYTAVFFSNMPEFGGKADDKQLFYNAITLGSDPAAELWRAVRAFLELFGIAIGI